MNNDLGLVYPNIYRATVLKQEYQGYLKLYIYGITPNDISAYTQDISLIDDLPPAEPALSLFGGTGTTNGFISYPHVSATVWCFFENNDYMKPVYFASCPAGLEYSSKYSDLASHQCSIGDSLTNTRAHTLVVGKNTLTFVEDGHVKLDISSYTTTNSYTTIDILPDKTDIYINNCETGTGTAIVATATDVSIKTDSVLVNAESSISLTAPYVEINGDDTIINGTTTINGNTTITPDAVIGGKSFIGHTHTGNVGFPTSPPL